MVRVETRLPVFRGKFRPKFKLALLHPPFAHMDVQEYMAPSIYDFILGVHVTVHLVGVGSHPQLIRPKKTSIPIKPT